MAAPDYVLRTFDLATLRDRTPIIDQGTLINGVTIQDAPPGAPAFLHFGSGRDPLPIVAGDSWDVAAIVDGCPVPLDEGLFMSNPAGAGNVTLIISFGPIGSGLRTGA